jgi:RES domain-containing protein
MIVYCIQKRKYSAWPPQGALYAEGRWNKQGQWIIYTSESVSLAKLEILANSKILPRNMVLHKIELSSRSTIRLVEKEQLSNDWRNIHYQDELHKITDSFLRMTGELVMRVPSAQSVTEHNYLINPGHEKFDSWVNLIRTSEEPFDHRLK